MSRRASLLFLHLIVLIFGFTGILGKEISLSSGAIVFFRTLIATSCLLVYLLLRRGRISIPRGSIKGLVIIGVLIAAHWITFFEAIKQSNISITLTTMATTSLFVAFIEPLMKKTKIVLAEVLLGLGVILGLAFIFSVDTSYHLGIVLALFSAFFAALFGTANSIYIKRVDAVTISFVELLIAFCAVGVYLLVTGSFSPSFWDVSAYDWLMLGLLGTVATAFAFVGSVEVMKQLSPFTVSLTINMEPIYSVVLALVFYGEEEKMTPGFYFGAAIIISVLFLNSILHRAMKRKKVPEGTF